MPGSQSNSKTQVQRVLNSKRANILFNRERLQTVCDDIIYLLSICYNIPEVLNEDVSIERVCQAVSKHDLLGTSEIFRCRVEY
ncbi:hypothetical protein CHS0354_025426 [Potamilus streckersoni]|uniref:Uncharacterized protein n=1 Tax=Potamilus streckersoni TaxID=2493646 RepID=A0AAE0SPL2_9BIVA|nr:hypothetical protein CHS0354_025426 [Potamilus streckersoni]